MKGSARIKFQYTDKLFFSDNSDIEDLLTSLNRLLVCWLFNNQTEFLKIMKILKLSTGLIAFLRVTTLKVLCLLIMQALKQAGHALE